MNKVLPTGRQAQIKDRTGCAQLKEGVMPYDKSLDVELFKETVEFEDTRVSVGVFQYNEGIKKLQLSRENMNAEGDWRFAKLGRMTKEEATAASPLIQKAIENM